MSFDPISNIMERDGVDEREAIRRYATEAASPEHKVCEVRDCPGFGVAHPWLPLDHGSIRESIAARVDAARDEALAEIERLARLILLHDEWLNEFIMANGAAFFTGENGTTYALSYYETALPLADAIIEWDEMFRISGTPMRFTATGEKVTRW